MTNKEIVDKCNKLISALVENQKYFGSINMGEYSSYTLNLYYCLINKDYQTALEKIKEFKSDVQKFLTNGAFTKQPREQLRQLEEILGDLKELINKETD